MPRILPILFVVLASAGTSAGQTAEILPAALNHLPGVGVGEGRYWQQLAITLAFDDAPGDSAVSVGLSPLMAVDDVDGDGQTADEVRVVYEPVGTETPGFFASQASTPSRVVLSSTQPAAAGGRIYLQFPIVVTSLPEISTTAYGAIRFGDPREQALSAGPPLSYVDPGTFASLGSMDVVTFSELLAPGPDTTTSALGASYPDVPQVLVAPLPDLAFDQGAATSSNLLGFGNGDNSDDVQYRFFFSTNSHLDQVDPGAALEARTLAGEPYLEHEGSGHPVQLSTRSLPVGTYYLYVISDLTGSIPLARSRGLQVRHAPQVLQVGPREGDITLDSGGLYDETGVASGQGRHQVALEFAAVDYDDTTSVSLFYSSREDLGPADVQVSEGVVTGLADAALIAGNMHQFQGSVLWDIVNPQVVPAGDYFVYAVASDSSSQAVGRSQDRVRVRHSPFLRLDPLDDRVLSGADTIVTGGVRPQRMVTITWGRNGRDGDVDMDDNARIDLYYSSVPAAASGVQGFAVPGDGGDLLADVGHNTFPVAQGLAEDPDGRQDNLYVWDLGGQARQGRPVPQAGQTYYVYGIIADSSVRRLVQMNDGRLNDAGARLVFVHGPTVWPLQPLADLALRPRHSARVAWQAEDLGGQAWVRVLLSQVDHEAVSDYATVTTGGAFVANSADGAPAPQVDPGADLGEGRGHDYLDLKVDHLRRSTAGQGAIQDGIYYVYLAIAEGDSFGSASLAWRAPGRIQVQDAGTSAGGGLQVFQILPESFSLGVGDRQRFDLRVQSGAAAVDLVMVTLKLDRKAFAVVDQDSLRSGIQPFVVGPDFAAAKLVLDEAAVVGDTTFIRLGYLDPTVPTIPLLDGEHVLASLELVALDQPGAAALSLAVDPQGQRVSHLENDGQVVLSPQIGDLASGVILPRGATLRGRLALDGRSDMSSRVDFSLRPWASYTPLQDSAFAAANDVDTTLAGVQVQVQADGSFALSQVPPGRLDLYAHLDGYLDAWVPGLNLFADQTVEGLRPTSTGQAADSLMLGGDVAGYLDLDGKSRPDNEVTLADWDYVAAFFEGVASAHSDSDRADITGDGQIDIRDLALVGANFLQDGPRPVFKPQVRTAGEALLHTRLEPGEVREGQEVVLEVAGDGVAGLRAWELGLRFDPAQWIALAAEPWPGAGPVLTARREQPGAWRLAASLLGRDRDFGQARFLARWRLRALQDNPEYPVLEPGLLLDQADRPIQVRSMARLGDRPLPQEAVLRQNYPNPFNPQTTIAFAVPVRPGGEGGEVRLEVFDALGQRTAVLWQGPLGPGEYQVRWNGCDQQGRPVGSGIYFYRLQSGSDRLFRRMALVR